MGIGLVVLAVAGILHKAFPELYKRKLRDKLVVTSMAQVGRAERRGRTGGEGEKGNASSLETTRVSGGCHLVFAWCIGGMEGGRVEGHIN